MSLPLKNEELIREAWLTKLEHEPDRQCFNAWWVPNYPNNFPSQEMHNIREKTANSAKVKPMACAMSMLIETIHPDITYAEYGGSTVEKIAHKAGLSMAMVESVVSMNDRRMTFSEIAKVVRCWFNGAVPKPEKTTAEYYNEMKIAQLNESYNYQKQMLYTSKKSFLGGILGLS